MLVLANQFRMRESTLSTREVFTTAQMRTTKHRLTFKQTWTGSLPDCCETKDALDRKAVFGFQIRTEFIDPCGIYAYSRMDTKQVSGSIFGVSIPVRWNGSALGKTR